MAAFITWRGPTCVSRCLVTRIQTRIATRNIHMCQRRLLILNENSGHVCRISRFSRHQWRILGTSVVIRHSSNIPDIPIQPVFEITDKVSQIDPFAVVPLSSLPEVAEIVHKVQEVPFSELGLGNYTPVGVIQNCLEFLHINLDLPWWGTIALATIVVRLLILPIVLSGQRSAVNYSNCMPTVQRLTKKMNDLKASGSQLEVAQATSKLQLYMKERNVSPLKNLIVPLTQAPIFISFFIALRKMAEFPVESLQTGGMYWFTDLSIADPYYIMPVIASLTLAATIELGGETGVQTPQMQSVKKILRIMPFAILPFTSYMPAAVFCYWLTSNFFTLGQVALLKNQKVRNFFKIPTKIIHAPEDIPPSEGFMNSLKSGWKNAQVAKELEQREVALKGGFKQAGYGAIPQTFDYDPTQPRPAGAHSMSTTQKPRAVRKKVTWT